jgi:hypothetical protein
VCNESDAYEDGEKDTIEGDGSRRNLSAARVDAFEEQHHRVGVRAGNCQQEPQPEAAEKATAICTDLDLSVGRLTHRKVRIVTNQSFDDLTI